MNKGWDIATQIQQGMKFDRGFGRAEQCPGEYGKTQIDGRGVECVDRVVEFEAKVFFGVNEVV